MHTRSGAKTTTTNNTPVKSIEKVFKKSEKKTKSANRSKTDLLVSNIISSIKENTPKAVEPKKVENEVKPAAAAPKKKPTANIPVRGKPKSGRPWKEVKQKFSKIKKSIQRRPFEKKEQFRNEMKHIKELSRTIKEEKKQDNLAKKQRREENAQRRLENERKSEIVQVIKNPAKLKRMKKKALRKIEKRDLDTGNGPKIV